MKRLLSFTASVFAVAMALMLLPHATSMAQTTRANVIGAAVQSPEVSPRECLKDSRTLEQCNDCLSRTFKTGAMSCLPDSCASSDAAHCGFVLDPSTFPPPSDGVIILEAPVSPRECNGWEDWDVWMGKCCYQFTKYLPRFCRPLKI